MRIGWHRNMELTDAEKAAINAARNVKGAAFSQKVIIAEYARLGREPVYAGEFVLSPGLVDAIAPRRRPAETTEDA